ncbi:RidA family protein [Herbaspirillum sp. RV1423]|uniref:RidA family protein n=1 Tax=Herbaspirillum sp. RV1423 TaxID=1443993 RepID=UPI0004BA39CD|nr:RidA family protein [Herbaspirillum sp. RV1423]
MKEHIDTGLPDLGQPFSWAIRAGRTLYTTHGPVRQDGTVETGPIADQAHLTFSNLELALKAAGMGMHDVAQVLIYLTNVVDMRIVDEVYRLYFDAPYPNRSTVGVSALVVPGMAIEIVAYAQTDNK